MIHSSYQCSIRLGLLSYLFAGLYCSPTWVYLKVIDEYEGGSRGLRKLDYFLVRDIQT